MDNDLDLRIRKLAERPYHRVITGEPVEGYLAEVPELPGCLTAGETPQEALALLEEAMAAWFESAIANGEPVPGPARGPVRLTA